MLPGRSVDGWKLEDSGGRGEQKTEGWGNWAFKINKQEKKLGWTRAEEESVCL